MAAAAAATAVLPPRAAALAAKTPVATAMAGEQTTINNQPKAAAPTAMEMATMTATTMTMEMKATAVAAVAEARRQRGGEGQLGSRGGSLPRAWRWRRRQHSGGVGNGSAGIAVRWRWRWPACWRRRQLGGSATLLAAAARWEAQRQRGIGGGSTFNGWREFGNRYWQFKNRRHGSCTERYVNLLHHTALKKTMRAFDGGRRRRSQTI